MNRTLRLRFFLSLCAVLAALLAAACRPPAQSEWPRLRLLLAGEARAHAEGMASTLEIFKSLDGTVVDVEAVAAGELAARLASTKAPPADALVLADPAAVRALARSGRIDGHKWLFERRRRRLAVAARPGSGAAPRDARELASGALGLVGVDGDIPSALTSLTDAWLGAAALAPEARARLRRYPGQAALLAAAESGEVAAAVVFESALKGREGKLAALLTADPRPELPPYVAVAVLKDAPHGPAARRLWCNLEKYFRSNDLGLVEASPAGGLIRLDEGEP